MLAMQTAREILTHAGVAANSASIKTAIQQANESANSEAGQDSAMLLTPG